MPEQVGAELPPQQFADEDVPRWPARPALRHVPELGGGDFAEAEMGRQHGGAVTSRVVTGDGITGQAVGQKGLGAIHRAGLARCPGVAQALCPVGLRWQEGPTVKAVGARMLRGTHH